jgi:hypothetical protein
VAQSQEKLYTKQSTLCKEQMGVQDQMKRCVSCSTRSVWLQSNTRCVEDYFR